MNQETMADGTIREILEKEGLTITVDDMGDVDPRLAHNRIRQTFAFRHIPEETGYWQGNTFIKQVLPVGFYPKDLDLTNTKISDKDARDAFENAMGKVETLFHESISRE